MSVEAAVRGRSARAAPRAGASARLWFRWLAPATTLTTYALIVLGGVVRVTESGDACPDWPRCHGELIPPLETQVLIEFSHRLVASIVGLLIAATALAAWRWLKDAPLVRWGAALAVVLVIGQIILGGVTVLNDLHSNLVTAHLALASTLLATLVVVTLASFDRLRDARATDAASFRELIALCALAMFALLLTGSYVSGSGAALAFDDWPLFNGSLLPEGGRLAMVHATHRFAAGAVGLLLAYVTVRAWRAGGVTPLVRNALLGAFAGYVAQVFVGAANIWTLLQPAAVGAHLALATGIWALLVGAAYLTYVPALPRWVRGEARS